MSMMEPFIPHRGEEEGTVPAADPGTGAPEPSEGFGVEGEAPDVAGGEPAGDLEQEVERRAPADPPFRTPEPPRR